MTISPNPQPSRLDHHGPSEDVVGVSGPASAEPIPGRKNRKKWVYGGTGLFLGILIGAFSVIAWTAIPQKSGISDAVESCAADDMEGVVIMDAGLSVDMGTGGEYPTGTTTATITCVLDALEAPQSMHSRIGSTRALDGTMEASWSGYAASWTYHPDNGLNIIVEVEK